MRPPLQALFSPLRSGQTERDRRPPRALPLGVWLLAVLVLFLAALAFNEPGFMDAYYYYHVAVNLAAGRGFTEDFIWIYLTNPAGLTHPSNLYWMPLTSIIAAPFLALLGEHFRVAQIPFVLISAAVPATTAAIARQVFRGDFKPWAAALLAMFSGFYLVYWVAIDSFGTFTLAATAVFVATAALLRDPLPTSRLVALGAAMGVATGVGHLMRADGPLLLGSSVLVLLLFGASSTRPRRLTAVSIAMIAYALIMLPWFLRNLGVAGAPLPGGGLQTIFLREYNEIFSYGLSLDASWYIGQEMGGILQGKALAALRNLAVLFGMQYWLAPFAVIGWWSLRKSALFLPPLIYGAVLYSIMTLVFTFPSGRGSMLHSSVVLLPWLCIATVQGIERTVRWIAARRPRWNGPIATRNFTLIFVGFSVLLSCYLVFDQARGWQRQVNAYRDLAPVVFADRPDAVPMVLNPPGWWYTTRQPALQTPSNGPEAAMAAATRYGATHLVIEPARSRDWKPFLQDAQDTADTRFELLEEKGDYRVYRIRPP